MDTYKLTRMLHAVWHQSCMTDYCHYPTKRKIKKLIWMLLFLPAIFSVAEITEAAESKILFIKSGSTSVYKKIIDVAQNRLEDICQHQNTNCTKPSVSIASINDKKLYRLVQHDKWDLIITVGTNAAKQLNTYKSKSPTLYSLIPSHSYPAIRRMSSSRIKSAIYIDQPIERQLRLIKSALPDRDKVGVVLGSYSGIGKQRLQQIMRKMGLRPVIHNSTPNNIGSTLEKIFREADVLMAQPDPSIYNKNTVLTVLLSSYRHNVPVFGYSAAFVRSGATAAVYSSPVDIGNHIGDEINKFFTSGNRRLSQPTYPKYFSVDTNRRVIQSLNIRIPSKTEIKSEIMKAK